MLTQDTVLTRADGTRITPRQVKRGLRISAMAGCLANIWVVLLGIPLTMMMECLKSSGVALGMIITVQQLATVAQIPGALLSERFARKKGLWMVLALAHRAMWFLPAALVLFAIRKPAFVSQSLVVIVAVSFILASMSTSMWYSWMADLIPDRMRSKYWSTRQSLVMVAYLLGLMVFGFLLDYFPDPRAGGTFMGFAIVFTLGSVAGCLDIIIHGLVPEPRSVAVESHHGLVQRLIEPLRDPDFRSLTMAMGMWSFGIGVLGSFSFIYLTRTFGVTYSQLSLLTVAGCLGTVFTGFLWGPLCSRIGARAFGSIMLLVAPASGFTWIFLKHSTVTLHLPWVGTYAMPQPILLFLFVNLLWTGFYSGVFVSQMDLLAALAPKQGGKTVWISVYFTVSGLLAAAGPLVGGKIMDYTVLHPVNWTLPFGVQFSFMHALVALFMAVTWFVALPLWLSVRRQAGEMSFGAIVSRLFVEQPLRLVSDAYTTGVMLTTRALTRAALELGGRANSIAVSNLIAKLNSPSPGIRAEAIDVLGQIGSPEAVNALVRHLENPTSDLAPQIARALRKAKSGKEVDILVRKVSNLNDDAGFDSIRALGETGDGRAFEPLVSLLKASDDPRVVAASGEALARVGEIAAIWEILPRMKKTQNPVLRQALVVAVGDFLGKAIGFQKVLARENEFRGAEVERLLNGLTKAVRKASKAHMRPEGDAVVARIAELQTAYDDDNVARAAEILFDIAIEVSALSFGIEFGGDAEVLVDHLMWRNPRFGVGIWYLDLLSRHWAAADLGERDWVDVLVGIYFLATHGTSELAV